MEPVLAGIGIFFFVMFIRLAFQCRYDVITYSMGEPLQAVYQQAEDALAQWRMNGTRAKPRALSALTHAVNEANRLRGGDETPHVFTVTGEDLVRDHLSHYTGGKDIFRDYDAHRLATSS